MSLNVLVHVPAVAHVSTGVMIFFSCFSLGKNVKHHSLDKEPSILDICFKVSKSPFPHERKKLDKKCCWFVKLYSNVSIARPGFLISPGKETPFVILGSQC